MSIITVSAVAFIGFIHCCIYWESHELATILPTKMVMTTPEVTNEWPPSFHQTWQCCKWGLSIIPLATHHEQSSWSSGKSVDRYG